VPVRGNRGDPGTHRVSTGTAELDEMLRGGLLPGRPYLIVGPSGTGKTTLALRFLLEGVKRGEESLIVTLEEPPNEMRYNHRALAPDLDRVWVFDAIPDVMRYERAPFKDVAQVRDAVRFSEVPVEIRKTPELTSVEITLTALEQTLKMQCARRKYTRLVIDSLTALQYFCMKGLDEVVGAQSFLRFLTDLELTTLLTMEAPSEEADSAERMLVRGEVRLFRWELEGRTVRAIGVEKFRGSSHDIRLHPYRIGPEGLRINLEETVSRDTREIAAISAIAEEHEAPLVVTVGGPDDSSDPVVALLESVTSELRELATARVDLGAIRGALEQAHEALVKGEVIPAQNALLEARGLVRQMTLGYRSAHPAPSAPRGSARSEPAPELPEMALNAEQLQHIVDRLSTAVVPPPVALAPSAEPPAPPSELGLPGSADGASAAHHASAVAFGPTFESLDPARTAPEAPAPAAADISSAPKRKRRAASAPGATRRRSRSAPPEVAPATADAAAPSGDPGAPAPAAPKKRAVRRKKVVAPPPTEGTAPAPPAGLAGDDPAPAPASPPDAAAVPPGPAPAADPPPTEASGP
jgi:KaiC/GvpD/RAD55 family RecA-like ATPase